MIALSWPGPFELLLLLVLVAGPAAVVLVLLRAKRRERPAFPVLPAAAEADGPGAYLVAGVDKTTRADRELRVEAASRANAQVKAELDGIVVTWIRKV